MGLLTPCFVLTGGFLYTMIVPGKGFALTFRVMSREFVPGEWFWMKLIAASICTVAGPDHNPRGGGQLPHPDE